MEQSKKIMMCLIAVFLLMSVNANGQYVRGRNMDKPQYEYPNKVRKLRLSGICTAAAAPVAGYLTYQVNWLLAETETTYTAKIYSKLDDHYIGEVTGLSAEEIRNFKSPYKDSYETMQAVNTTKYPLPKWTPWAVGGTVLAVGAILWGIGESEAYRYRVEVNRNKILELSFVPSGIILNF